MLCVADTVWVLLLFFYKMSAIVGICENWVRSGTGSPKQRAANVRTRLAAPQRTLRKLSGFLGLAGFWRLAELSHRLLLLPSRKAGEFLRSAERK